jgi:hypothetical protein
VHPQQPQRRPSARRELVAPRIGGLDVLELQATVREPAQRLVGERRQLGDAHAGLALDAHEVEVEVARKRRGPHDRAVRPRLVTSQTARCAA